MKNKPCASVLEEKSQSCLTDVAVFSAQAPLPVWRASFRSALVSVASVIAVGLISSGMTGCADMSGIHPQASLRDAPSLGLTAVADQSLAPLAPDWWRDFGDETLNQLVAQALTANPNLKLAQARLARAQAMTDVAHAATLPQVNGQLDLMRQRYTAKRCP